MDRSEPAPNLRPLACAPVVLGSSLKERVMVARLVPAADSTPMARVHPIADAPAGLEPSLLLGEPYNPADAYHRTIADYCGRLKPGVRLTWRGRPDAIITAVDQWSV